MSKSRKTTTPITTTPIIIPVTTSTHARTAKSALGLLKWPLFGALLAGGALVVARLFGPRVIRDLGAEGGEGFAEGVARIQDQIAALRQQLPSISGERGRYQGQDFADYLQRFPGFAGAGVTLQESVAPRSQWSTVYEVRWLRGFPVPMLPPVVEGYPVKLEIVDTLPAPQPSNRGSYT